MKGQSVLLNMSGPAKYLMSGLWNGTKEISLAHTTSSENVESLVKGLNQGSKREGSVDKWVRIPDFGPDSGPFWTNWSGFED